MRNLKEILDKAPRKSGKKVGHISHAEKVCESLRKEIGNERFVHLVPSQVYFVVWETMTPEMREWVKKNRGNKYKGQVATVFYEEKKVAMSLLK